MEIDWKQLRAESISMQFTFVMVIWTEIELTDFSIIKLILKLKQYENVDFVYYGKTRMWKLF